MASDRWLTKNEYSRLRYQAKKMGAVDVCLFKGHFSDKAGADAIKKDMDKALEFIEMLKEFDKTISK